MDVPSLSLLFNIASILTISSDYVTCTILPLEEDVPSTGHDVHNAEASSDNNLPPIDLIASEARPSDKPEALPTPEGWVSPLAFMSKLMGYDSYQEPNRNYYVNNRQPYNNDYSVYQNPHNRIRDNYDAPEENYNQYYYEDTQSNRNNLFQHQTSTRPNHRYPNTPSSPQYPKKYNEYVGRRNQLLNRGLPTLYDVMNSNVWQMLNPMNLFSSSNTIPHQRAYNNPYYRQNQFQNSYRSKSNIRPINNKLPGQEFGKPDSEYTYYDYDQDDFDYNLGTGVFYSQQDNNINTNVHSQRSKLHPTPPNNYNPRQQSDISLYPQNNVNNELQIYKSYDNDNETYLINGDRNHYHKKYREEFPLRDDLYIGNDGGLYLKPKVIDGNQFLSEDQKHLVKSNVRKTSTDLYGIDMYGMEYPRNQKYDRTKSRRQPLASKPYSNYPKTYKYNNQKGFGKRLPIRRGKDLSIPAENKQHLHSKISKKEKSRHGEVPNQHILDDYIPDDPDEIRYKDPQLEHNDNGINYQHKIKHNPKGFYPGNGFFEPNFKAIFQKRGRL